MKTKRNYKFHRSCGMRTAMSDARAFDFEAYPMQQDQMPFMNFT